MKFTWMKVNGSVVEVDTANPNHRSKGAANHLAKNLARICGGDLARLSEAQRWLGTFMLDGSRASQRRYAAIDEINGFLSRAARLRYVEFTSLAVEGESAAAALHRQMTDAAVDYLMLYEAAILTSRPFLSPLLVRGGEAAPEIQPQEPRAVFEALLSLPAGPAEGGVWSRDGLRMPIARALDRLYPHGRSWIEPHVLEAWHTALYTKWQPGLHLLPLIRRPAEPARSQPPSTTPPLQPSPTQQTPPQSPGVVPAQSTPVRVRIVTTQEAERQPQPEPDGDPHDQELTAPAQSTAEDDIRHARELARLEALVDKQMATLSRRDREALISVRNGAPLPTLLALSPTNTQRLAALRATITQRRALTAERIEQWAEVLMADGFDLRGMPATIKRLKEEGKTAQAHGYEFQVQETLKAWSEYRLVAVEAKLPGDTQPWPRNDRFIDTLEWISPGTFRFREYKAYNADLNLPLEMQTSFRDQSDDYWAAIFGNPFGYAVEYIFEQGVPEWARNFLIGNARHFHNGLVLTDLRAGVTEYLNA
ncbi:hypothetical protein GCM10022221_63800 [Actinocorallia aurea]